MVDHSNFEWDQSTQNVASALNRATTKTGLEPILPSQKLLAEITATQSNLATSVNEFPDWVYRVLNDESKTRNFGSADDLTSIRESERFKSELEKLSALVVEQLLNQASELLERASADRDRAAALRISHFHNWLELQEFIRLDEIHLKEIKSGRYSLAANEESSELDVLELQLSGAKEDLKNSTVLQSYWYSIGTVDKWTVYATELAVAAGVEVNNNLQPDLTSPRADFFKARLTDLQKMDFQERWLNFRIQDRNRTIQQQVLQKRYDTKKTAKEYAENAAIYTIDRVENARNIFLRKVCETVLPDGATNYEAQLKEVYARIGNDMAWALSRLTKASVGLQGLFGYADPLPADGLDFEHAIVWTRNAVNWLRTFSNSDNNLTVIIPIRSRIQQEWDAAIRNGALEFNVGSIGKDGPSRDSLDEDTVWRDFKFLRLRGLSLFSVRKLGGLTDTWVARVTPPRAEGGAFFHFQDRKRGAPSNPNGREAAAFAGRVDDQTKLQSVYLGRVTERDVLKDAEIVGAGALYNASPFGRWRVDISSKSLSGNSLYENGQAAVNDFHLQLNLVGQHIAG